MEFSGWSQLTRIVLTILIIFDLGLAETLIKEDEKYNPANLNMTNTNATGSVTIYTEANFLGIPWSLSVSNCTDVPFLFYKKASSINTHDGCVILFSREKCQGRHVRIEPGTAGHSHLTAVGFDNTMVSLRLCENSSTISTSGSPAENKPSTETGDHSRVRRQIPFLSELMKRLGISNSNDDDDDGSESEDKDSQETGRNNPLNMLQALFGGANMNNLKEDQTS